MVPNFRFLLTIIALLAGFNSQSQTITGIVHSKTSTIQFDEWRTGDHLAKGQIQSNLSGSKYTVEVTLGNQSISGEIRDKMSKYLVNLQVGEKQISGEIKRAPNHTSDTWNVDFMGTNLTGKVVHNAMNTQNTYELQFGEQSITGKETDHQTYLKYALDFLSHPISGEMKYNVTTVKHTYNLTTGSLTEEEFVLWWFLESIKLLNEHVDGVEEFQNSN